MTTTRFSQQVASFALAAVMTFAVLAGLGGLADTTMADSKQLASTMCVPRA